MTTTTNEIADGIYRLSTFVPGMSPTGFTFNQSLIAAEQPLLFHTGPGHVRLRLTGRVITDPLDRLAWVTFGHLEGDECGAMNLWLTAAPRAEVAHTVVGCMTSIADVADRPPAPSKTARCWTLGGRQVRSIDTTHVPHGWEAHVLFEDTTGTLLCGDILTQVGNGPASPPGT